MRGGRRRRRPRMHDRPSWPAHVSASPPAQAPPPRFASRDAAHLQDVHRQAQSVELDGLACGSLGHDIRPAAVAGGAGATDRGGARVHGPFRLQDGLGGIRGDAVRLDDALRARGQGLCGRGARLDGHRLAGVDRVCQDDAQEAGAAPAGRLAVVPARHPRLAANRDRTGRRGASTRSAEAAGCAACGGRLAAERALQDAGPFPTPPSPGTTAKPLAAKSTASKSQCRKPGCGHARTAPHTPRGPAPTAPALAPRGLLEAGVLAAGRRVRAGLHRASSACQRAIAAGGHPARAARSGGACMWQQVGPQTPMRKGHPRAQGG